MSTSNNQSSTSRRSGRLGSTVELNATASDARNGSAVRTRSARGGNAEESVENRLTPKTAEGLGLLIKDSPASSRSFDYEVARKFKMDEVQKTLMKPSQAYEASRPKSPSPDERGRRRTRGMGDEDPDYSPPRASSRTSRSMSRVLTQRIDSAGDPDLRTNRGRSTLRSSTRPIANEEEGDVSSQAAKETPKKRPKRSELEGLLHMDLGPKEGGRVADCLDQGKRRRSSARRFCPVSRRKTTGEEEKEDDMELTDEDMSDGEESWAPSNEPSTSARITRATKRGPSRASESTQPSKAAKLDQSAAMEVQMPDSGGVSKAMKAQATLAPNTGIRMESPATPIGQRRASEQGRGGETSATPKPNSRVIPIAPKPVTAPRPSEEPRDGWTPPATVNPNMSVQAYLLHIGENRLPTSSTRTPEQPQPPINPVEAAKSLFDKRLKQSIEDKALQQERELAAEQERLRKNRVQAMENAQQRIRRERETKEREDEERRRRAQLMQHVAGRQENQAQQKRSLNQQARPPLDLEDIARPVEAPPRTLPPHLRRQNRPQNQAVPPIAQEMQHSPYVLPEVPARSALMRNTTGQQRTAAGSTPLVVTQIRPNTAQVILAPPPNMPRNIRVVTPVVGQQAHLAPPSSHNAPSSSNLAPSSFGQAPPPSHLVQPPVHMVPSPTQMAPPAPMAPPPAQATPPPAPAVAHPVARRPWMPEPEKPKEPTLYEPGYHICPDIPTPNGQTSFIDYTHEEFAMWAAAAIGGNKGAEVAERIVREELEGVMVEEFLKNPQEMKDFFKLNHGQLAKARGFAAETVNRRKWEVYGIKKRRYEEAMKEYNLSREM